ncbi:flagellar biosynthesis protein FlgD [Mobiluncus mulieris]|uniref:Basal-body rod modification protein FlgD n=1 Tax=Mobiluncus mulieris TaxID=2052 RepID=A0ABD4TV44_9ACTO|nr:flagellar biosynthesis protein FlgD [Mobiluncus mulieris]MCU9972944.1 flagellar biosynthesis protein FlgD [Mobiluncus mulieris]MCV0009088.1 flagellar biosynthesis protein FlgD [Mobiluncus mulieris]NMW74751.1 flagellar biosynthesis protein FlgD [Mobiluncus mulieris]NMX00928.1 flagellar biosynthesis protein FlgD [Mobiluncus mulieris]
MGSGAGGATAAAAQAFNKAPSVDNYSIGANAKKKAEAETLATNKKLTDREKAALFLKKMNEGQRTDKAQTKKEDPTKLGKDDFMKLLLATLKYQDPTQPMDTAQLLEQTSTMTNMEQMIQMTEASKRAYEAQQRVQGASMVGRTAVYDLIDDEGNAKTTAGKVDAVEFLAEGKVLAHIGDKKVKMEDILGIADPTEGETDLAKAIAKALREQNQDKKTGKAGKTGEVGKTGETGKPGETGKSAATRAAGTPGAVGSAGGSGVHEAPAATAGTTLGSTPTAAASAAAGTSNRKPSATGVGVSNTQA